MKIQDSQRCLEQPLPLSLNLSLQLSPIFFSENSNHINAPKLPKLSPQLKIQMRTQDYIKEMKHHDQTDQVYASIHANLHDFSQISISQYDPLS